MSAVLSIDGQVAELRLCQPPANEIGTEMLVALERALDTLETQSDVLRALILYSDQERGFCAGAHLRELYAAIAEREPSDYSTELAGFLDRIHAVMNRLDGLSLTTIGAVHGVCFGGGFELALTCDLLVADRSARFCFPELRLGIIPGFGGIPRLKRELSNAAVRDLLLTGRSLGARRAGELGLVSQVVAKGEALAVARDCAKQASLFLPDARVAAKRFVKAIPTAELEEEKAIFLRLFQNPAVRAALGEFVSRTDAMPYQPLPRGGQS